jgi:hypothetical protein
LKGPGGYSVKVESAILIGLQFLNRGFLVAPHLHVDPSKGVAVLIYDPAAHSAIAFLSGLRFTC